MAAEHDTVVSVLLRLPAGFGELTVFQPLLSQDATKVCAAVPGPVAPTATHEVAEMHETDASPVRWLGL